MDTVTVELTQREADLIYTLFWMHIGATPEVIDIAGKFAKAGAVARNLKYNVDAANYIGIEYFI